MADSCCGQQTPEPFEVPAVELRATKGPAFAGDPCGTEDSCGCKGGVPVFDGIDARY